MMRRALLLFASLSFALAAASASADITVLTYNLGLLKVFGSNYVPLVDIRAKAAPAELAKFAGDTPVDIILLEEVWRDQYANAIAAALAPLGYTAIMPKVHTIVGLSSGLLLLVKQPLKVVDWKFTPFVKTTFTDSFARKGVLEATIENESDGTRFVLVGTHTVALDTNNGTPTDKAQVSAIMSQAAQIRKVLASRSRNGTIPALLMGDFNVGPGYVDDAYRAIASDSVRETGATLQPQAPLITWDPQNPLVKYGNYPNEPPAKIDHVFLQDGTSMQWVPRDCWVRQTKPVEGLSIVPGKGAGPVPIPLSDHYAFLVRLDLLAAR